MTLGEFTLTLEVTVDQVNEMLNMINTPHQVPTMTWAKYMDLLQAQAAPQIIKLQTDLEAVQKANEGEKKDGE